MVAPCWNISSKLTWRTALLTKASALSITLDSLGSKRDLSVGRLWNTVQCVQRGEGGGKCYFRSWDRLYLETPLRFSNLVSPFPSHVHQQFKLFEVILPRIVATGTQNSRGSSSFPGGICILGWKEELMLLSSAVKWAFWWAPKRWGLSRPGGPCVRSCHPSGWFHPLHAVAKRPFLHERLNSSIK